MAEEVCSVRNGKKWDLVVLGGGPGGVAAAIHAARAGLETAIVERLNFPRDRPGESLHPGIDPILDILGVKEAVASAGFLRTAGFDRVANGNRQFFPFGHDEQGDWYGYQVWRARFDTILLAHARQCGVHIFQSTKPRSVRSAENRVAGVKTNNAEFHAAYVIDGTGRSQWLSRKIKLPWKQSSPRLIAWYGYLKVSSQEGGYDIPTFKSDPKHWSWVGLVKPGVLQWTRLSLDSEGESIRLGVPEQLAHLEELVPPTGADVSWKIASPASGPGYFLIGDAAATLDPASSQGVLRAMVSGIKAADYAIQINRGSLSSSLGENSYDQWMQKWHRLEVKRLAQAYMAEDSCPNWVYAC